jgi:hypothetical protein
MEALMGNYTRLLSGATILAVLCSAGSGGILLEDIRHTGTLTLDHFLSLVVLAGSIGAGVMAIDSFSSGWRGSLYCFASTAGRSAETQQQRVAIAETTSKERERIGKLLARAEAMLEEQRGRRARECASGEGKACKGSERSVETYEAAVKGHKADLAQLEPERPVNAKAKNIAQLITAFTKGDAVAWESLLALIDPNIPALFAEAGSILFWHIHAMRRRQRRLDDATWRSTALPRQHADVMPPPPGPGRKARQAAQERQARVSSFVAAYRARHGCDPSPRLVREATGLPRSTAWRYQQTA